VPRPTQGPRIHDLDALRELYAEADGALEGWSCEASTDCCHFGRTGREPYLWPNEWALLEHALRGRQPPRASLPLVDDERRCPLLGRDGRCSAYAARPFGCRTFFCERAQGPTRRTPRGALADLGKRIAGHALEADPSCDGPRALTRLLESRWKR
jgi:Fe-S-cluster containining protein